MEMEEPKRKKAAFKKREKRLLLGKHILQYITRTACADSKTAVKNCLNIFFIKGWKKM